jgi:hypothetical protein
MDWQSNAIWQGESAIRAGIASADSSSIRAMPVLVGA